MHDSGGADTCGSEIPITSAVAILFSCFDWGTGWSQSLAIGRACGPLVIKTWVGAFLALKRYESPARKVPAGNGLLLVGSGDYSLPLHTLDAESRKVGLSFTNREDNQCD
jgi:hypothetical protein